MSQKLPVNGFKWVKKDDLSKFNENFEKNVMKTVIKDIFLKSMLNIQKNYLMFTRIYHFYREEKKLINVKSLFVV